MIKMISGINPKEFPPVLWVIMVIAAIMRLVGLTDFSLSNDELSALARLQFSSLGEVIRYGVYPDFHPAGVQLFLYLWTSVAGFSDLMVRLPFAILGAGSVLIIFLIGRRLFGLNTGLLAAAALATLEYPLLYSQIARPYSPGLFFVLSSFLFLLRVSDEDSRIAHGKTGFRLADHIGFVITVSACMYIHYFSFLQAGMICIAGVFIVGRKNLVSYVMSLFIICVMYIPHIPVTLHHLSKGGIGGSEGWLGPPEPDFFEKYLRFSLNDSTALFWIFIVLAGGFILANREKLRVGRMHLILFLLFIVPFLIGYYYSILVNPVLQYSVLLFSFPFLLLLMFSFSTDPVTPYKVSRLPVYILLFAGMYSSVNVNRYYQKEHFSEFRKIAEAFAEFKSSGYSTYSVINIHDPYYIHHYLPGEEEKGESFNIYRIQSDTEYEEFLHGVESSNSEYCFYAWSNMYNDPLTEQVIRSKYPCLADSANYLSSGYRLYRRYSDEPCTNESRSVHTYTSDFEWMEDAAGMGGICHSGSGCMRLSPEKEYGFFVEYDYPAGGPVNLGSIELEAMVFSPAGNTGALMVAAYEIGSETVEWKSESTDRFIQDHGDWYKVFLNYQVPENLPRGGVFKLYCWNEKKRDLMVDDVRVNFYSDIE